MVILNYHRRNGHQPAGGSSLLVDLVTSQTAVFAFGVKKLRSAYSGSLLRVRRSSDDTEQDIGADGDAIDQTSLESFCSGTDGFVVTLYNQMGGSSHLTNSTAAEQPKIVTSGSYLGHLFCTGSNSVVGLTVSDNFGLTHNNTWSVFNELGTSTENGSGNGMVTIIGGSSGARWGFARDSPTSLSVRDRCQTTAAAVSPSLTIAASDKFFIAKTATTANRNIIEYRKNNGSASVPGSLSLSSFSSTMSLGGFGARSGLSHKVLVGWTGNLTSDEITAIHAA